MARYIDTSKVTIPEGFFEDLNVPKLLKWLNDQPTADVVPKSEVHESVEKLMSATDKVICEAKREVAREIFEEIEKWMFYHEDVTHTVHATIGAATFAELKKKYTEEINNENH